MNRQIVTLIHENMVSRLASLITGYILDEAPSMFVGTFGITSESGVNVNRDRIMHYAHNSGLIHDIGKLCVPTWLICSSGRFVILNLILLRNTPVGEAR